MTQRGVATAGRGISCKLDSCDNPRRASSPYCSDRCKNLHWRLRHARRGTPEEQLAMSFGIGNAASPSPASERLSIQERFETWLADNPEVWQNIRRYAYAALRSGRSRFGIAAIIERVRWDIEVEGRGDAFKVNNDYRSRITRKLIEEDPRFEDFFETRELKTA